MIKTWSLENKYGVIEGVTSLSCTKTHPTFSLIAAVKCSFHQYACFLPSIQSGTVPPSSPPHDHVIYLDQQNTCESDTLLWDGSL